MAKSPNETVEKPLVLKMFKKISHNRLRNCQNIAKMLCGIPKTRRFSAFLSHFSKIIFEKGLIRQFQRLAFTSAPCGYQRWVGAWTLPGRSINLKHRKCILRPQHPHRPLHTYPGARPLAPPLWGQDTLRRHAVQVGVPRRLLLGAGRCVRHLSRRHHSFKNNLHSRG